MSQEEVIKALQTLLPPMVSYAELIGAEGAYAHAGGYVWTDPEPYYIKNAIELIQEQQIEIERLERLASDRHVLRVRALAQRNAERERADAAMAYIVRYAHTRQTCALAMDGACKFDTSGRHCGLCRDWEFGYQGGYSEKASSSDR